MYFIYIVPHDFIRPLLTMIISEFLEIPSTDALCSSFILLPCYFIFLKNWQCGHFLTKIVFHFLHIF